MSSSITNRILDRYVQGCAAYRRASTGWMASNFASYEAALVAAARDLLGAAELAMKGHLRGPAREGLTEEEALSLRKPTFHRLLELMQAKAQPRLQAGVAEQLNHLRNELRSPAEHEAAIPAHDATVQGVHLVRDLLCRYYSDLTDPVARAAAGALASAPGGVDTATYLTSVEAKYRYMDLGGISPRVGSKVVRIAMTDLFVPLRAGLEMMSKADGEAAVVARLARTLTVDEVLSSRHTVVLGDPGAGKTTLGRYVAYNLAVGKHPVPLLAECIPIVVRAFDYSDGTDGGRTQSLYDYVIQEHSDRYGDLFKWAIGAGKCLIVVDGLDEVPNPAHRVKVAQRVDDFALEFPELTLLVSSRIVGYRQNRLQSNFEHVVLSDFDDEQIREFLVQWHEAVETESGLEADASEIAARVDTLWSGILENAGVRKLAGNPLLLTIIALANWRGTKLPSRRVEVYEIATETLIENWPLKQRGLRLDAEEILKILEPIAYAVLESGRQALIAERELRPLFERQVGDVKGLGVEPAGAVSRELLKTIEEHTGFFVEKGLDHGGQRLYGFLHLTFAEYLTARHFAELWSRGELDLSAHAHVARWREVLLLTAGRIGSWATAQATRFVNDVVSLKSPGSQHINRDVFLAADMLADNVRVDRDMHDSIIAQLVRLSLLSPHREMRQFASEKLVAISTAFPIEDPIVTVERALEGELDATLDVRAANLVTMLGSTDSTAVRTVLLDSSKAEGRGDILLAGSRGLYGALDHPNAIVVLVSDSSRFFFMPDAQLLPALRSSGIPTVEGRSLARKRRPSTTHLLIVDQAAISLPDDLLIRALTEGLLQDLAMSVSEIIPDDRLPALIERAIALAKSDLTGGAVKYVRLLEALEMERDRESGRGVQAGLAELALSHPHPEVRSAAVEEAVLDYEYPERAAEVFRAALGDVDVRVPRNAAQTFADVARRRPDLVSIATKAYGTAEAETRSYLAAGLLRSGIDLQLDAQELARVAYLEGSLPPGTWRLGSWLDGFIESTNTRAIDPQVIRSALVRFRTAFAAIPIEDAEAVLRHVRTPVSAAPVAKEIADWFEDRSTSTRVLAFSIRRLLKPEHRSTQQLLAALTATDRHEQQSAIGSLSTTDIADSRVHATLLSLLDSEEPTSTAAARALAKHPDPAERDKLAVASIKTLDSEPTDRARFVLLWELFRVDTAGVSDIA